MLKKSPRYSKNISEIFWIEAFSLMGLAISQSQDKQLNQVHENVTWGQSFDHHINNCSIDEENFTKTF